MKARYAIVKTYWRDNRDPFPGRLTETRIEKVRTEPTIRGMAEILTDPENQEERNLAREWTLNQLNLHNRSQLESAAWFESLADAILEGGYQ